MGRLCLVLLAAAALAGAGRAAAALAPPLRLPPPELAPAAARALPPELLPDLLDGRSLVRTLVIGYRTRDGLRRRAYVVLPAAYRPRRDPPLPLVIAPHGRGVGALACARLWGDLPALGRFALVAPEGQGRVLERYSWGYAGQIADLASLPAQVERALPWLRVDPHRIYAIGGSMGGQEVLLLVARDPALLAGAAALDAPTDMALQYRDLALLRDGRELQRLARIEFGGTPRSDPGAYAARSPIDAARALAFSGVPLELWWSPRDQVVRHGALQSGLLYRRIVALNPAAPVVEVVGNWRHSVEMRAARALAPVLASFGLLPSGLVDRLPWAGTDVRLASLRLGRGGWRSAKAIEPLPFPGARPLRRVPPVPAWWPPPTGAPLAPALARAGSARALSARLRPDGGDQPVPYAEKRSCPCSQTGVGGRIAARAVPPPGATSRKA